MENSAWKQRLSKYAPLLVIVLAGTLLRVLRLDFVPPGLNQDEASAGYEAWAIANYGIDRNGHSFPVLLESWGSGQNALYSYVCALFLKVFRLDLNVVAIRLPMAIAGSVSVATAYRLGLRVRGHEFGLLAALVLAVNPWHLTASRWALESNLLPFFVLLAMCLLTAPQSETLQRLFGTALSCNRASERTAATSGRAGHATQLQERTAATADERFAATASERTAMTADERFAAQRNMNRTTRQTALDWAIAGAALGLSLYAYGTAMLWVPLFAVGTLVYAFVKREVTRKQICAAFAAFCVLGFPIVLCNVRNVLGLPEMKLFGVFTLPQLTATRQAATMSLNVLGNLRTLLKLLWTQDDGLLFNVVPGFGLLFGKVGLLFVIGGVIAQIRQKESKIVLISLASGVVTALFIDANINRVNVLLMPLVILQARGIAAFWQMLFWALSRLQKRRGDGSVNADASADALTRKTRIVSGAVTAAALAIACSLFAAAYFGTYREELRGWFEPREIGRAHV
jgi:hypothetical protein